MKLVNRFLLLTLFITPSLSFAAYSSITVFGDSLSDAGSTPSAMISYYKLTGDTLETPSPYADFRFSNGPVAVEYLATGLGLNDTSHFFDYAVGGAETSDIANIVGQYTALSGTLDSNALYVIQGGANDLLNSPSIANADSAVANITNSLNLLYNNGARNFLVENLPLLGTQPVFQGVQASDILQAQLLSSYFNANLSASLSGLSFASNVKLFDTAGFFNSLNLAGFNTTEACLVGNSVCSNPDAYVFWDDLHPTTEIHRIWGNALLAAVVPEPDTFALLIFGVAFIGFSITRRKS